MEVEAQHLLFEISLRINEKMRIVAVVTGYDLNQSWLWMLFVFGLKGFQTLNKS